MLIQTKQEQFMQLMGHSSGALADTLSPKVAVSETARLYLNLCQEEVNELSEAFQSLEDAVYEDEIRDAVRNLVGESADLLYVLCGLCNSLGINLESAFEEVHGANMRKAQFVEGEFKILRRDDGKILKPEGWQEPDLDKVIDLTLINQSI